MASPQRCHRVSTLGRPHRLMTPLKHERKPTKCPRTRRQMTNSGLLRRLYALCRCLCLSCGAKANILSLHDCHRGPYLHANFRPRNVCQSHNEGKLVSRKLFFFSFFLIYTQPESYMLTIMHSSLCLPLCSTPHPSCNCFKPNLIWDNQQKDEPGLSRRVSALCEAFVRWSQRHPHVVRSCVS